MASIVIVRGKYRASIRRKGQPPLHQTFEKRSEAERWAEEIEQAIKDGKTVSTVDKTARYITFAELVTRYIEEIGPRRPIGKSKMGCLNNIKNFLGNVELRSFDENRVLEFAKLRADMGAGGVTINLDLSYISHLIRTARGLWKMKNIIDPIPDARESLKLLKLTGRSKWRERRASDEEIAAIKGWFSAKKRQKIPMWDIIDFAVVTTMRAGEITRITWDDLDEEAKTIIIRDRKDPQEKIGNDQKVPLLGDALAIIQRQPRKADEPRIFPYNESTFSTIFPRAVQALKIDDLHFHDLRHEGISRLFDQGYQIPEVAVVSGHKSWEMLKRYTHIKPEVLHKKEAVHKARLQLVA